MISRIFKKVISFVKEYWQWIFIPLVGLFLLIALNNEGDGGGTAFLAILFFGTLGFYVLRWLLSKIKFLINLKHEKQKTELLHLQSQINPHFFFNMLNNLYGMVEKENKKARELVLKLSDMMRYSIYEGQHQTVPLENEIEHIENFIALHRMRYKKKIEVDFNVHTQHNGLEVLPLLFIILVENSFKHGVEKLTKDAFIKISLIGDENSINFGIENNFDPEETAEKPGIGLKNLQRRLDLVYPKRHSFSYSQEADIFKAQLSLRLQ